MDAHCTQCGFACDDVAAREAGEDNEASEHEADTGHRVVVWDSPTSQVPRELWTDASPPPDPFAPDPAEAADPDDVLHHITVANVETLHGMVLTEDQAEQIKDRLAQALTRAINEIRGINPDQLTAEDEMAFDRQIVRDGR